MEPELVLKAISYSTVGLLLIVLLLLLRVGLRRENDGGSPVRGLVQFGLFLMGVFTFIALMSGYFQAAKVIVPERISEHMDRVSAQRAYWGEAEVERL